MTKDANEYLEILKNDFFALRIEWRLYRSFFGTNKETVKLLNDVSGPTAHTLERVLFERTLLGIRRLTDSPSGRRGRSQSVTIKGLVKRFDEYDTELRKLVNAAERSANFARNWSDKRIAHSDLDYRQGKAELEKASRANVEGSLEAIAKVLKWVGSRYLNQTLVTHPVPPLNDERQFLEALYRGQREISGIERLERQYLKERRFDEIEEIERTLRLLPKWLHREYPPLDVD